jgi:L-glutamine-phosphate cytidylyltransferase
MKAIIFAAGMSSRLEELTENLPKSCLEIESGLTMIERNLLLLEKYGFDEIRIITGHAKEAFDKYINQYKSKFKILETIFNPLFKERNNIYTAYLTKDFIDEKTLIINSDLVVAEKIIDIAKESLLNSNESFMMIDDFNKVDEESMKVFVDDNQKITRVHKSLELEQSLGEYIGILRISKKDLPIFFNSIEKILEAREFNLYYEDAIDRASKEMNVFAVSTEAASWTEIDTKEDYSRAKDFAAELSSEIKVNN